MNTATLIRWIVLGLILAKWAGRFWLGRINVRNVQAHAQCVPEAFKAIIDQETYAKSVRYTLERSAFSQWETAWDTVITVAVLFSGVLPGIYHWFQGAFGPSTLALAAYLFAVGVLLSLPSIPFDWYDQFRLEERFGFNTSTLKIWWLDRLKGLLLAVVLGYPLLILLLKMTAWTGDFWWIWGWAALFAFQLVMMVLAPVLILPLFNKFTPLAEGSLRERLLELGRRTGFLSQSIQIMDGSRRSRHSNAFFTGFGGFRKIVLFDTLIQQLTEPELEAVLAHEIGHYRKHHIPKLLLWSAFSSLVGFYVISWLARQAWFYQAFGFEAGSIVPALLLFMLISGTITFWFSPLANLWSRRHEYEADAFAAEAMGEIQSLVGALRKLNEKNLGNLTPHPWFSSFYYSHPTLLEREQALGRLQIH